MLDFCPSRFDIHDVYRGEFVPPAIYNSVLEELDCPFQAFPGEIETVLPKILQAAVLTML
jgi:hypothetical protein